MYQRTILDNQLRVLSQTMPHTHSVSMVIAVGAGSRYEPKELAGLSHFLEHLPFKGTKNWPTAREVSEAIEGVGGLMNASTDREMTVFWCKVARPHFRQAFAVLLDMLLNPVLDPEEMEKEREVIQEELRMTNDYPTQLVDLLIDETLWPDQAMGRDVGGTPETVNNISVDDVREYMH
ncbi:MAG TPA: pitrilysin family protein, partial [Dehalococcoidia bacterium]|nr:pitrilysin family protein [Dehalococcoidia bacterium]